MNNKNHRRTDLLLLVSVFLLLTVGLTMIYSSSSIIALSRYHDGLYFLRRQFIAVVIGMILLVLLTKVSYQSLHRLAAYVFVFSILLLMALFIPHVGVRVNNATRWLRLGGINFQVTELVKITLVLFLAHYFATHEKKIPEFKRGFLVPLGIVLFVVLLIVPQPDFGTAAIIAFITLCLLFLAGVKFRYLMGFFVCLLPGAIWLVLKSDYRLERLKILFNPWKDPLGTGFQIIQSFISFGSGGFFGVGIGDGMQKLYYLPEPHTDFILSVIAEEGGFIAVCAVIFLFVVFIIRGFLIAYGAPDLFGTLLAAGITMTIAVEAAVNIAGVMGLIPVKGLALPFVSYGGSSVTMSLAGVGLLLNVYAASHR